MLKELLSSILFEIELGEAMKVCDKCHGSMILERAVDLEVGLKIMFYACLNCGRRVQAEKEPHPLVH